MEQFTKAWFKHLIENLDEQSDFQILEANGRKCALSSGMLEEIDEVEFIQAKNLVELFEVLKQGPFKSHHLKWCRDAIELGYAFKGCVCPVMKAAEIKNSHACQCTVGFIKTCLDKMTKKKSQLL